MSGAMENTNHRCRIVLTGGPGGGKTTAADLMRREIGDRITIVPEAATLLFSGGFPRSDSPMARRSAQMAIYHVQRNLENICSTLYADRILLCDRGTVDSAVYWPNHEEDFFSAVGSSLAAELERYHAVIFFESAAVGNLRIEGGNPMRLESIEEARLLDQRLHQIWGQHQRFYYVPHQQSFFDKLKVALSVLHEIIRQAGPQHCLS